MFSDVFCGYLYGHRPTLIQTCRKQRNGIILWIRNGQVVYQYEGKIASFCKEILGLEELPGEQSRV